MNYQVTFWMLVAGAIILIIGIVVMAGSIQSILKSEGFKKSRNQSGTDSSKIKTLLLLLMGTALGTTSYAAAPVVAAAPNTIFEPALSDVLGLVIVNVLLLFIFIYFRSIFNNLVQEMLPAKAENERSPWFKLNKVLVDAVELEDEGTIMMEHEYDGIRELDNNLPPWWKWGFYATIVFAFIYLGHYHVFKTGDLQIAEFDKSNAAAEVEIAEYKKLQNLNVDESTATLMTDASDIGKGRSLFMENCISCHGEKGEGGIGVNLADDHWLYGNDIKNVFITIKYGAQNGMRSWNDDFNGVQIQQISSFVISLQGTNPPNGKEPQGEFFEKASVVTQ